MARAAMAAAFIHLEFDGLTIKAWSDKSGETYLKIGDGEDAALSPTTALILGHALIQLAKPEAD